MKSATLRRMAARSAVRRYIRKKRRKLKLHPSARGNIDLLAAEKLHKAYGLSGKTILSGFLFPVELAHVHGIYPIFTEILAAVIAGSKFATLALEAAENRGYSRDGCSFHRAILGAGTERFLPKFSLVVATSHLCDGQNKSLEALAGELDTPYFLLDVPQEATPDAEGYLVSQLSEIESKLTEISRKKIGQEDWNRVFQHSNRARDLMVEFQNKRAGGHPLSGRSAFNFHFQSLPMYGTPFLPEIVKELLDEMETDGEDQQEHRRYRLIWALAYPYFRDNFIPWMENELGMSSAAEELSHIFWQHLDPKTPLRSLARRMLQNPLLGPGRRRVALIEKLVKDANADGVIHYSHWGCRQGCGGSRFIADALKQLEIPYLDLDGDAVDNRNYSEGQTRTRLEGFAELMDRVGKKSKPPKPSISKVKSDLFLGIDIGSLSAKAAVVTREGEIVYQEIMLTGASTKRAVQKLQQSIFADGNGMGSRIGACVSTGYGRNVVDFADKTITEITCHARGMAHQIEGVRTIIDIGGQDTKAIAVDEKGEVRRFLMNDKCAAGTGRFLEVMARTLEIDLEDFGGKALEGKSETTISSMCTVFAESEVVSLIADGVPIEDIARGVCNAIASRTVGLLNRVGREKRIAMSGGVAKNLGVVRALESNLNLELVIPPEPQVIGAIGAALIAREIRSTTIPRD
jgi:predicted CoA-substrate-specific enzyme activase